MKPKANQTRRQFIQRTALAGAGAIAFPSILRAAPTPPSERLTLGFVGIGMMGRSHLGRFSRYDDVQVEAICEIEPTRRANALQTVEKNYAERKKSGAYKGCKTYTDFREIMERKDIDAVVISTPDHTHALISLHAIKAGKDIYCEKPLTHNIREGRLLVEAAKKKGTIFQTGSQQRSEYGGKFRRAVELVWNGAIGEVKTIRVGVGAPAVPCDLPAMDTPDDLDWDQWIGPAAMRPYSDILCPKGMHRHFPAFRKYQEFAGGGLADMGAHHFDIAQWGLGMDASGPVRIEPPADGKKSGLKFTYANGVVMYHGGRGGTTFEGTEGTIAVDRGRLESTPDTILKIELGADARRVMPSNNHHRNWLEAVRKRKQPICHPEVGHRTASICHLANIGYRLGRALDWDPEKEKFKGDREANKLTFRKPRSSWKYPRV